ncbi:hypothetical protein MJ1_0330 [Nanobdella aerobiophila]|uniref:Uncharacterized protein n=1 Tax=Nanobdella aerobiophila TaxID=2586965 RepID=A0A915SF58_9ARCH|nr:hypothetical protein [Nanobdella aerobiophila]BBL45495.1 hypothetical protein MJ1_0330 [Nanobdella aerobiophila]
MYDFCLPNDNEEELLEEYYRNKIKNIVLCYYINDKKDLDIFKIKNILYYKKLNIFYCALINNDNLDKSLNLASELFYSDKYYNDLIYIIGKDFNYNEKISEKYFYNGINNFIRKSKKYYFYGISYSSMKKIKKNNLSFLIDINTIKKDLELFYNYKKFIEFAEKKYLNILIGSFAEKKEEVPNRYHLYSFYKVLGLYYSLNYLNRIFKEQIIRTRLAKRKDYFTKGFYIISYPYQDCKEY